jgi:hypothetical protein
LPIPFNREKGVTILVVVVGKGSPRAKQGFGKGETHRTILEVERGDRVIVNSASHEINEKIDFAGRSNPARIVVPLLVRGLFVHEHAIDLGDRSKNVMASELNGRRTGPKKTNDRSTSRNETPIP